MPEKYLRQPGFTYKVCAPFTKKKEIMKKFKRNGRFKIYSSIKIGESVLLVCHSLWRF